MVKLGQLNSRMKDFRDIWLLSRQFNSEGATLASAVTKTFANQQTVVSAEPVAVSKSFADDPTKVMQWRGFLRKSHVETTPKELAEIVDALEEPASSLSTGSGRRPAPSWTLERVRHMSRFRAKRDANLARGKELPPKNLLPNRTIRGEGKCGAISLWPRYGQRYRSVRTMYFLLPTCASSGPTQVAGMRMDCP